MTEQPSSPSTSTSSSPSTKQLPKIDHSKHGERGPNRIHWHGGKHPNTKYFSPSAPHHPRPPINTAKPPTNQLSTPKRAPTSSPASYPIQPSVVSTPSRAVRLTPPLKVRKASSPLLSPATPPPGAHSSRPSLPHRASSSPRSRLPAAQQAASTTSTRSSMG